MADQDSRRLEIKTQFPRRVTSSTHDEELKGNNFRRAIHSQSFIVVAFIFSELEKEGRGGGGGGGGLLDPPPLIPGASR